MADGLTWITENADRASIVVFLALALFIVGFGAYKQWWVPGSMYQKVVTERDELQDRMDERAERIERKLEIYEGVEQSLSRTRPRRRNSGSRT